uniref:SAC domain-containing protein n=1 Tax=Panagrolaimus superbus TaxID=310955 RepID=A0A914YHN1_9BILA
MQFFASKNYYFAKCIKSILRICRTKGELNIVGHSELAKVTDLQCIGEIDAVIGKLVIEETTFLLAVTHSTRIATRIKSENEIRKIERICALPIDSEHQIDASYFSGGSPTHIEKIKKSQIIKFVSGFKPVIPQPKVVDEILRLFNDNGDFYYETAGGDITNNLQKSALSNDSNNVFFWNKALLTDILEENSSTKDEWIIPIVQGYVAQKSLFIDGEDISPTDLTLTLISRRSIKRAGTRYLRRGIDDDGNVANFVETELIIDIFGHQLSYVQIRGSVPVYWSQKGYKYRPPLTIDKKLGESLPVFEKHINKLIDEYGKPVIAVNLVNQAGRELCIAQSFLEHILEMNSPDLGYISFDFHYHCRALRFHKVADLMAALKNKLSEIGYCWIDKSGELVLRQKGVIRTNCIDCLDRTNVVQGAINQIVSISQFRRLGLISPMKDEAPEALVRVMQEIWADNGDAISRQYAGTDALKGDITRSGQRKFTGLVKDGYNSASRYYLSHMRDAQRQLAIDTMLAGGVLEPEDIEDGENSGDEVENIARLVNETVRFVLKEDEILVGGWALVDGDTRNDIMDSILLLTRTHVYIAQYEEETDKLTDITSIAFEEIVKFEVGKLSKSQRKHLRIYWESNGRMKFDSWRAAKTRLFNNVAIPLKDGEEADEYVTAISEQLRVTVSMCSGKEVPLNFIEKLNGAASIEARSGLSSVLSNAAFKIKAMKPPAIKRVPPQIKIDSNDAPSSNIEIPRDTNQVMPHSQSEGLLSEQSGFVSKLSTKLKTPWKVSAPDVVDQDERGFAAGPVAEAVDPFQQYKDVILKSKSLIKML